MKKTILKSLIIASVIFGYYSCSSGDDSSETLGEETVITNFERSELLANWSDNIIIPALETLSGSLSDLTTTFNLFNTNRDEVNLTALRGAWRASYFVWQRASMFEIGPAENIDFRLNMNIFPADVLQINTNVNSLSTDLSLPSNRDAKGFPAIDYLINGIADSDAEIVARFNDATEGDALINYLESLVLDMESLTNQVLQEWQNSFRDEFVANDGATAVASVDLFVNDYIFYFERFLRAGKIGIPAGVFSNTTLPQNLEAFYDETLSNDLFLEGLDAVQSFFNGNSFNTSTSGIGLDDYLNALNRDDLTSLINDQFDLSRTMVTNLNSFQQELENNPPVSLLQAYDEVQRLVPLLKVDMLSVLNINVDFQDADGD